MLKHDYYSGIAAEKNDRRKVIPARRGRILDRNGEELAVNIPVQLVYADGSHIHDPAAVASVSAPFLEIPVKELTQKLSFVHRLLENKWYIDELYEAVIIGPIKKVSEFLWRGIDVGIIDRVVLSFGRISTWTGETVRVAQTGAIQVYALALLLGILAIVGYLIYGWV